jgi:SP family general alpha glucoside:H+ symporter-like MFS transporter
MQDTVIPTVDVQGIKNTGLGTDPHQLARLLEDARLENEADASLTIRQALKKYKKATFWAMFLSVSGASW